MVFAIPAAGGVVNVVVRVGVSFETCKTKFALEELLDPSTALMVQVYVPKVDGAVPEITPVVVFRFKLPGNGVSELTEQAVTVEPALTGVTDTEELGSAMVAEYEIDGPGGVKEGPLLLIVGEL